MKKMTDGQEISLKHIRKGTGMQQVNVRTETRGVEEMSSGPMGHVLA